MEHTDGKMELVDSGIGTITCIKVGEVHIAQLASCNYKTKTEELFMHKLQIANARRICQCWNNHDALLAACKEQNNIIHQVCLQLLRWAAEFQSKEGWSTYRIAPIAKLATQLAAAETKFEPAIAEAERKENHERAFRKSGNC